MKRLIAVLLLALLLATVGCGKAADTPTGTAGQLSEDISGVDTLEKDMDTSELNGIEKDLDGVSW